MTTPKFKVWDKVVVYDACHVSGNLCETPGKINFVGTDGELSFVPDQQRYIEGPWWVHPKQCRKIRKVK